MTDDKALVVLECQSVCQRFVIDNWDTLVSAAEFTSRAIKGNVDIPMLIDGFLRVQLHGMMERMKENDKQCKLEDLQKP